MWCRFLLAEEGVSKMICTDNIAWRCTVSPNEHYTTTKMWSRFTDSAEEYLNEHCTTTKMWSRSTNSAEEYLSEHCITTKMWSRFTDSAEEYLKVQEEMISELMMRGVYITYNSCECVYFDNVLFIPSARTIIFMSLKHLINVCHVTGVIPLPCSHCSKISAVIPTGSPRLDISMLFTLLPSISLRSSVPKCL